MELYGLDNTKGEERTMLKKFSVFVLALIVAILFSGCSSNEAEPVANDSAVEETDTSIEDSSDEVTEETTKEEPVEESNEDSTEVEVSTPTEASYAEGFKHDITVITEDSLELSQESYDFIVANHTLLPAMTDADINKAKGLADPAISYKLLNKNAAPYFSKFASFTGSVISVEETQIESGDTVSLTHVMDDEYNSYQVFMYKGTGDILEEDRVQFWGIPVGVSSFENVSGGITNVQVFFGAHIEKVN
jgi:hypothetical protein